MLSELSVTPMGEGAELRVLLDDLAAAGVQIGVEPGGGAWRLVLPARSLSARGLELVARHRTMLVAIGLGRQYTGHAVAFCTECGEASMLSIVNSSGTSRGLKSTPWPRCIMTPRCTGRRVIAEADREGVPRVRSAAAPRQKKASPPARVQGAQQIVDWIVAESGVL